MKVFVLSHMRPSGQTWRGQFVGVYSSQAQAALAIARLSRHPSFKDYPKGFQVDAVELDADSVPGIYFYSVPPPPQLWSPPALRN
ncbi:MAG TPA: hypothetical protein VGF55_01350 [Gemmataceae bacterium]|jgi:hypothetical protein